MTNPIYTYFYLIFCTDVLWMSGPDPDSRKYVAENQRHFDIFLFHGLLNVNLWSITSKNETSLHLLRCTVR